MCKDYREEFLEWIKKTAIYPKLSEEDIESSLFIAKCWLNNDKFGFNPARYNRKSLARLIASQFCWYIKDQRIAELEEQLKNAIVLKLKVGQEVYVIENKHIFKDVLEEIEITEDGILFYVEEGIYGLEENEIFATKEEALAKLEELKGE